MTLEKLKLQVLENGKIINLVKYKMLPVSGDASFREFYRINLNKKNRIFVIAKKDKYKNLIVYSTINNYLRKNKVLAPKLYAQNYSKGIIIIEDFGDLSLYKLLLKKKNRLKTYKQAIDLLIKIQKIKYKKNIKDINNKLYLIKEYSNKILEKESDLFWKWYLPLFLNKQKTLYIKKKIKKILSKIYKKLDYGNKCLVHRDFHAQNLMKVGNKISIIDSQDALIGNPAYDLVSLIDDVRIKTSNNLKENIYEYYLKKNLITNNKNNKIFLENFNILSVQRNLKIIGIFSRLFKRDKKKKYLKLIPHAWKLVESRINSNIFVELKKLLDANISKKNRQRVLFR